MTRLPREYRDRLKYNVYNARMRGMAIPDICRSFNINEKMADTLLKEALDENYNQKSAISIEVGRSLILDQIDEGVITTYNRIQAMENNEDSVKSPGQNAAFFSGMNTIRSFLELKAKIEGHLVQRVSGADGKGPVEITVEDKQEAIEEIVGRLQQIQPQMVIEGEAKSYDVNE